MKNRWRIKFLVWLIKNIKKATAGLTKISSVFSYLGFFSGAMTAERTAQEESGLSLFLSTTFTHSQTFAHLFRYRSQMSTSCFLSNDQAVTRWDLYIWRISIWLNITSICSLISCYMLLISHWQTVDLISQQSTLEKNKRSNWQNKLATPYPSSGNMKEVQSLVH